MEEKVEAVCDDDDDDEEEEGDNDDDEVKDGGQLDNHLDVDVWVFSLFDCSVIFACLLVLLFESIS